MTAELRLFAIETRRSVALLVLSAVLGLFWFVDRFATRDFSEREVVLWTEGSSIIGNGAALLGPVVGGLAAWAAGRDRRRGMEDLLATTPRPAAARDLTLVAVTVVWGLLAYLAVGVYVGAVTTRYATWGGPLAPPIVLGAATVVLCAAVGYAVGAFPRPGGLDRLMPALVPIALFFLLLAPMATQAPIGEGPARTGSIDRLWPWRIMDEYTIDLDTRPEPALVVVATVWLLGVSGAALAIVMLRRRRTVVEWGVLAGAGGAAAMAATLLVRSTFAAEPVSYEPVCTQPTGSIPVCLHPAYETVVDETAEVVAKVMAPLVGVPGAPIRAQQAVDETFGWRPDGTLGIYPYDPREPGHSQAIVAIDVAGSLAHGPSWYSPELDRIVDPAALEAQDAIALWLLRQTGWADDLAQLDHSPVLFGVDEFGVDQPASMVQVEAAAGRFAALRPEQQRAWLDATFAALQAGELTLEDLP